MATTFTLKRKYFADPNQQAQPEQKKSGVGKKIGLAGLGLAATAAGTAFLATKGAGTKFNVQGIKSAFSGGAKNVVNNVTAGAQKGIAKAGTLANQGIDKAKGIFSKPQA